MSQEKQQLLSGLSSEDLETPEERSERLVPVSEAIRYRKRAQAAEEQVENLSQQLADQRSQEQEYQRQLEAQKQEVDLTQGLIKAGIKDLEVGLLLAGKQLEALPQTEKELESVVEQMQQERPHLFEGKDRALALGGPTAGVRGKDSGGITQLKLLAEKAVQSGNRRDVQNYLRFRRSVRH